MKEYLLTTNEFLVPDHVEGSNALGLLMLRLLLLQPGQNPLHPDMGVGLGPKYRFITEDDMNMLQDRVQDQINTYLPNEFITKTNVYMQIKPTHYLKIVITAEDTNYVYDTEESDTPIELSDLVR
jgi:hypothetical protein